MKTKLAIAADHAGVALKKFLIDNMSEVDFMDFGPNTTESVDYPDFAEKACKAVLGGLCDKAVLICGSGLGMSIAANKLHGIRAAHVESSFTAGLAAEHNNANVLCIGERITGQAHALAMVRTWLSTPFGGFASAEAKARHQRRIDKIHKLES